MLGLKWWCFLLQSWDLSHREVGDESSPDSGPPGLASKKGKVQGEGAGEGPRWGLRGRIKAQSCPAKAWKFVCVCVSLVAAPDVRVNGNYVREWNVVSGVFLSMEGISRKSFWLPNCEKPHYV